MKSKRVNVVVDERLHLMLVVESKQTNTSLKDLIPELCSEALKVRNTRGNVLRVFEVISAEDRAKELQRRGVKLQ